MKGLCLSISLPPPVLPAMFLSVSILETHEYMLIDDPVQFVIYLGIPSLSNSVGGLLKTLVF